MQQTEKTLEDYTIKSPISGTVITKNAKAGDTIDKTNSASTLMVVADVTSKTNIRSITIDELSNLDNIKSVMIYADKTLENGGLIRVITITAE